MDIGYVARRGLVPLLMEWVYKSRMKEHLPSDCIFIMFLEDTLFFHFSHLSSTYKAKHILPNLSIYSLSLFQNLTPTIESWSRKNYIDSIEFQLKFFCEDLKFQTSRLIKVTKEDKDRAEYLNNKSV